MKYAIFASGLISALGDNPQLVMKDLLAYKTAAIANHSNNYFDTTQQIWRPIMHAPIANSISKGLFFQARLNIFLELLFPLLTKDLHKGLHRHLGLADNATSAQLYDLLYAYPEIILGKDNLLFYLNPPNHRFEPLPINGTNTSNGLEIINITGNREPLLLLNKVLQGNTITPSNISTLIVGVDSLICVENSASRIRDSQPEIMDGEGAAYVLLAPATTKHYDFTPISMVEFSNHECIEQAELVLISDIKLVPAKKLTEKIIISRQLGNLGYATLPVLLSLAHHSRRKTVIIYENSYILVTPIIS